MLCSPPASYPLGWGRGWMLSRGPVVPRAIDHSLTSSSFPRVRLWALASPASPSVSRRFVLGRRASCSGPPLLGCQVRAPPSAPSLSFVLELSVRPLACPGGHQPRGVARVARRQPCGWWAPCGQGPWWAPSHCGQGLGGGKKHNTAQHTHSPTVLLQPAEGASFCEGVVPAPPSASFSSVLASSLACLISWHLVLSWEPVDSSTCPLVLSSSPPNPKSRLELSLACCVRRRRRIPSAGDEDGCYLVGP